MTRIDTKISPDLPKFLVAGGVSFIVNQLALAVIYEYGLGWMSRHAATPFGDLNVALLVASVIAVEISIIARFLLNDVWTFRDLVPEQRSAGATLRRLAKFNLICLAGLALNVALLNVQFNLLGVNRYVANAVAIAAVTAWNFLVNRALAWRASLPPPGTPPA